MDSQPFSDFMAKALYDPLNGYYMTSRTKIGPGGDFITAPQSSPFLATALALAYIQLCQNHQCQFPIVEIGAGTGDMAKHLLNVLKAHDHLPPSYDCIDISPSMQQRQQDTLQAHHPSYFSQINFQSNLSQLPEKAFVIANELLDALPTDRFQKTGPNAYQMLSVSSNAPHQWIGTPCTSEQHQAIAHREAAISPEQWPIGYHSELHDYDDMMTQLSNRIHQGIIYWIDYGYHEREYFHPQRHSGTLTCFYQHQSHDDPFKNIGEQDISIHVDFSELSKCLNQHQWHTLGFCTQEAFLLSRVFWETLLTLLKESPNLSGDFNRLVAPYEMGQTMKVMQCSKGLSHISIGFDRVHTP